METSERSDLYVGKRVLWRFAPRGGYGFVLRVPVTIEALHRARATVLVEGKGVRRVVSRRSLIEPPTMRGVEATVEPARD